MGLIRLLLSAAVIIGHIQLYWRIELNYHYALFCYYAVQMFFVISGFYISLILTEKYAKLENGIRHFYINRYLRIAPAYWIVATFSLLLLLITLATIWYVDPAKTEFVFNFTWQEWSKLLLLAFSTIFIFGMDIIPFLSLFGMEMRMLLLVPQAWTLGAELLFYLLSPLLIKLRTRTIIALCIASYMLRFVFAGLDLPFWPWQQCFAGCEIMFFLFGILAYRFYKYFAISQLKLRNYLGLAFFATAVFLIAGIGRLVPSLHLESGKCASYSLMLGLYTMLAVPFIFTLTSNSKLDRLFADLSYPAYLLHICLGFMFRPWLELYGGFFLVFISVLFAVPIVFLVERPIEKYRNARLTIAKQPSGDLLEADAYA